MTDRTPDHIEVSFWDGPLSGGRLVVPHHVNKIVVTLCDGRILRYEADCQTTRHLDGGGWADVCRMVETRLPNSFDDELTSDLRETT